MPEIFQEPQLWLAGLAGFLIAFLLMMSRQSSISATMREQEKAHQKTVADLAATESILKDELKELRHTESSLLKNQGILETQLSEQKKRQEETKHLLETTEERFTDTFKALSADALKLNQQQFLNLAKTKFETEQQTAKGELEKREQAVAHLVKPVAESLEKMQTRIGEIEKVRENAYATLKEQVRSMADTQKGLQKETSQLVKALRQPIGRGQWGEMQLQRVVEMAGMQEHCDFITQATTTTEEGKRLRPDLIVKLPGGQQIVVDAKTPMDAYLDALEADDDETRESSLNRHATQVATHIRQLSSKNYQAQFQPAPEFVVLFLPSESFFSAALTQDSTLLEQGVDQGVILATPTTLIALLRSVAYGWRQETLAENARQISDVGRELHKRLATFTAHLNKIGKSLDTSVKSYNQALGSLERMVIPSARKFETLEAAESQTSLPDTQEITTLPREPHLLPQDTDKIENSEPPEIEDGFEGFTPSASESAANDIRAALED